jgi:hypothetical protein
MRCRINQGQAQAREKAMKLYAVRMIESCQPVGLFWAKDVSDLVVAIDFDDVMSPTRCECESACKKDPLFGVIGFQSGPRHRGSTLASMILGSRGWDAGRGDDCKDPPRVF